MTSDTSPVVYLSDLIGKPVRGVAGETIGRLKDLIVRMEDDPFPPVTGLVLAVEGRPRHRFFVPARHLASLPPGDMHLTTSKVDLRPFARRDGEALLNKDVLDKQIIDINGRRVIRVNDVTLTRADDAWRLAGADVSGVALLHRLGLRRRAARMAREIIPWDPVQFFASEVPDVKIQLKYDRLARLHPMDIARLVNELSYKQGSEIIAGLEHPLAADTVQGMAPEMQAALIGAMDIEEAADILDEMAPDDAADLIADLPQEQAEDLLEAMNETEATEVKRLLEYPQNTAGGIMTTEYVAEPQHLTAEQVIDRLRAYPWLPDVIYYVYALGNPLKYTDPTGHVNIGGITPDDAIPSGCLTPCEIVYSPNGLTNTWNAVGDVAALVVSVASEPADWIMTLNKWRQGDFQAWDLLGLAPLIPSGAGRLVGGTIDAARPLRYLRHTDPAAFETLMGLGARNGEQIFDILNSAGSDAVIRGITDRAGNQIALLAGNRSEGLRHILGRHLTGDIPGGYTTFFSKRIKVGDVVDLIAQTVQNGERTWNMERKAWTYTWYHETWGWITVVVNEAGEVVSAYPK